MKFFLDTEFIEAGPTKPIQLVSIGIVSEAGHEFYAISSEFNPADASPWVLENVLMKLEFPERVPRQTRAEIAAAVHQFVCNCTANANEKPKFYGYYADYDWVVFAQMWGTMMDLPKGFPMFCRDLIQTAKEVQAKTGIDAVGMLKQPVGEHNALVDAHWNRKLWTVLDDLQDKES